MFEYEVEQKTYMISGVKIGGQPGEIPTVMIGSLFYKGQKIIDNYEKGVFHKGKAEKMIKEAEEQTDKTGLPSMIDLGAANAEAAEKYLDFVASKTEMPIVLDISSEIELMKSLQYANDQGIMKRIVLNSLNPHTKEQMYRSLKDVNCENAILLLYSMNTIMSSDKRLTLEELLPKAEEAGIKNILVDTVVLDIPSLGLATYAIHMIKDQYGYPSGCGAHNAIETWRGLKKKFAKKAALTSLGVVNALPIALGGDFVLYGPIENARLIYPSIALIDAAYSQHILEKEKTISREHPRYKIC